MQSRTEVRACNRDQYWMNCLVNRGGIGWQDRSDWQMGWSVVWLKGGGEVD